MPASPPERILHRLKTRGAQSTGEVAAFLGVTLPGAKLHLCDLKSRGLVTAATAVMGVGRPKLMWGLAEKAQKMFPDGHEALMAEFISAIRDLHGEKGLDRLIKRREDEARSRYMQALKPMRSLAARVEKLAGLRSSEGYMAEWQQQAEGVFLLIENHCPICAAARTCQGFCRSELHLFQSALGAEAKVSRIEHIVTGARRCAYRIERAS